jgi:hypothetical protein
MYKIHLSENKQIDKFRNGFINLGAFTVMMGEIS